jgi:hypothetical protein
LVLVGDPEQLQAIEAGAAFRAIAERVGAAEITRVRRQRTEWQREATREFATGQSETALGRYIEAGSVQIAETRVEARAALVAAWERDQLADPAITQLILAPTRADVHALNVLARGAVRESGALGADVVIATERGERSFAVGDRLMFLRNERALGEIRSQGGQVVHPGVAVKNGTLGTLLGLSEDGATMRVRLGGEGASAGAVVSFSTRDYAHIDHGYAATVHKSQGVTVDRSYMLASGNLDRHMAYVAMTRHRDGVEVHFAREDFASTDTLTMAMSRERAKDTTLDYLTHENGELRESASKSPQSAQIASESPEISRYAAIREIITNSEIRLLQNIVAEAELFRAARGVGEQIVAGVTAARDEWQDSRDFQETIRAGMAAARESHQAFKQQEAARVMQRERAEAERRAAENRERMDNWKQQVRAEEARLVVLEQRGQAKSLVDRCLQAEQDYVYYVKRGDGDTSW